MISMSVRRLLSLSSGAISGPRSDSFSPVPREVPSLPDQQGLVRHSQTFELRERRVLVHDRELPSSRQLRCGRDVVVEEHVAYAERHGGYGGAEHLAAERAKRLRDPAEPPSGGAVRRPAFIAVPPSPAPPRLLVRAVGDWATGYMRDRRAQEHPISSRRNRATSMCAGTLSPPYCSCRPPHAKNWRRSSASGKAAVRIAHRCGRRSSAIARVNSKRRHLPADTRSDSMQGSSPDAVGALAGVRHSSTRSPRFPWVPRHRIED